jgi:hypothetical protein
MRSWSAEHQPAILEQLLARLGESREELIGRLDEPEILVLGRSHDRDELEVRIILDRLPRELQLEARLAFVIEDALAPIADVDLHVALVVLRDHFAGLRRHLQAEHARPGLGRRESHAHRHRIAVGRQRDRLRSHDAPAVLDVERDGLSRVAGLRDHRVDEQ